MKTALCTAPSSVHGTQQGVLPTLCLTDHCHRVASDRAGTAGRLEAFAAQNFSHWNCPVKCPVLAVAAPLCSVPKLGAGAGTEVTGVEGGNARRCSSSTNPGPPRASRTLEGGRAWDAYDIEDGAQEIDQDGCEDDDVPGQIGLVDPAASLPQDEW